MRYLDRWRARTRRMLVVSLAILTCVALLGIDAYQIFSQNTSSLQILWLGYGFSALTALIFLVVGIFVFLYARDRRVALPLFCFSVAMMVTFVVETVAVTENSLFSTLTNISSALALAWLSLLLLYFPKNYLSLHPPAATVEGSLKIAPQTGLRKRSASLLRGYITLLFVMGSLVALLALLHYWFASDLPSVFRLVVYGYYLLGLGGTLITILVSYRQSVSVRERQQRRIFVGGMVLAIAPFMLLTVLTGILNAPTFVVGSQFSTLTLVSLPLALGYSILRYNILVFDRFVRRIVSWLLGVIGVAVLSYLVIALLSPFVQSGALVHTIWLILLVAVLAPFVWWAAHTLVDRVFFSEIAYYRRLIERPDLIGNKTFDLDEAAQLLVTSTINVVNTQDICLFVLDDDTGFYRLCPALKEEEPTDVARGSLIELIVQDMKSAHHVASKWISMNDPLIQRLAVAPRPLLLSETKAPDGELPTGLARYFMVAPQVDGPDPLLAPVWVQGKMIGVLVLGERGDHQQYAGPDLEAIHMLLARFSPVIETARLYAQSNRHVVILNTLYGAQTIAVKSLQTVQEVAEAYAKIASEAVQGGAEIWLYSSSDGLLKRSANHGAAPLLSDQDRLRPSSQSDWSARFYAGGGLQSWKGPSQEMPSCLSQTPNCPIAWLPLMRGEEPLGVLSLVYPRPHLFVSEEMRILQIFASQCAISLENAKITIELRAAYERQKELDRLKDEFVMTASHELRTPLTAVQGYIELLVEYSSTIEPETLESFIAGAARGCKELTFMVENMMEASRVQADIRNLTIENVSLAAAAGQVLELSVVKVQQEYHPIQVHIPAYVTVIADNLRLQRLLLNLLDNAFKYSPPGSVIEVTATVDEKQEWVTVRVRDRGLGVLLEYQENIFERFTRLERDMNSPVRGAGLGLSICRELIEAMGGRIWVESTGNPYEGSIFVFTLKCSPARQVVKTLSVGGQEA